VLIDFGKKFITMKEQVKYYTDLSTSGSYLEAINRVYDALRWAET